ncbi:MAG TPA: hypothetical protein VF678_06560, partial [bacterium]
MFRRHNQILLTLLILMDLALVLSSWNLAYWLRFRAINLPPAQALHLSDKSIAEAEAQGLPHETAERLVRQVADAYSTEFALHRAVDGVLRRDNLQQFTDRLVEHAIRRPTVAPFEPYFRVTASLLPITVVLFYLLGVYRTRRFASLRGELEGAWIGAAGVVLT